MLRNFFLIPFTAGIEDGVNPCFLITFSVVLLLAVAFRRAGITRLWLLLFLAVMVVCTFAFNCGFLDWLILSDIFQIVSRAAYLGLSVFVGIRGWKYFREWVALLKGKEVIEPPAVVKKVSPVILFFGLVTGAFVLSMISTLWPINSYVMTFSVYMMLPGKLLALGCLVFIYTIMSFWFVGMALPILFMEKKNPRVFKMMAAAILMAASLGVIDIIFMKG